MKKPPCVKLTSLVVLAVVVVACDEFTCADYATCEVPDSGRAGTGASESSGIQGEVTNTAGSFSKSTSAVGANDAALAPQYLDSGRSPEQLDAGSERDTGSERETKPDEPSTIQSQPDANVVEKSEASASTSEAEGGLSTDSETLQTSSSSSDSSSAEALETNDAGDGGPDDASVEPPAPRCDPTKPFGRPFAIHNVNLDEEIETVTVAPDGLTMYVRYGSDPTMYISSRDAIFEDFDVPRPSAAFDAILEQEPTLHLRTITADGLTAYFSSDGWGERVQSAHRASIAGTFQDLVVHEELHAFDMGLGDPWVALNGERLYGFLPAAYTVWVAALGPAGFEEPVEVYSGNTTVFVLSSSERVLYVGSTSVIEEGIVRAERANNDGVFSNAQQMSSLTSAFYDIPLWVSDDDCEIVFAQHGDLNGDGVISSDVFLSRRGL